MNIPLDQKIIWAADRIMAEVSGGTSWNMNDRWKAWTRDVVKDAIYLDLAGETIPKRTLERA